MNVDFFRLGAVLTALAIVTGAFGAHGVKFLLDESAYAVFQTGADYHFMNALGIALLGLAERRYSKQRLQLAAWIIFIGIVLFSGSLYVLAVTGIKWFGFITPVGGSLLIIGWLIAASAAKRKSRRGSGSAGASVID